MTEEQLRHRGRRRDQPEDVHESLAVLSTTLDMIVNHFDRMEAVEIRELAWVAKYESDKLVGALR